MADTVKMCNMNKRIAAVVFKMLNQGKVRLEGHPFYEVAIITDIEPKNLVYPEGWYYAKGKLRNKHTSTTGLYEEIPMLRSNGSLWRDIATYCTLD